MMQSQPTHTDAKANLRGIRVFFGAMIVGVVMFTIIVVSLYAIGGLTPGVYDMESIIRAAVFLLSAVCLLIARMGLRKAGEAAKNLTGSLNDKLNNYRSSLIKYMALCEGPAIFSIITFFLTGDHLLLAASGVMVAAMLLETPTKNKVVATLGLDWNEQAQL